MDFDVSLSTTDLFLALVPDALYWLVLGSALLVWIRARRSGAAGRRRMSLVDLMGVGALLLAFLSMPIGPALMSRALEPARTLDLAAEATTVPADGTFVAIFSGGIARLSDGSWQPKPASVRRALRGKAFAERFGLPLALSGGNVPADAPAEARVIAEALDFDPTVRLDVRARNTHENALGFARLAAENGWRRAIVVTDGVHLRRAGASLRAAGIEPVGYVAADGRGRLTLGLLVPRPGGFAAWRGVVREVAGTAYYLLRGRFALDDLAPGRP